MLSPGSVLERDSRTLPLGKHGEGTPQMTHNPFGNNSGARGHMLSYMTWAHQEAPGSVIVPLPPVMTMPQARLRGSGRPSSSTMLPASPTATGGDTCNEGPKFRYAGGTGKPRLDPGKVYNE